MAKKCALWMASIAVFLNSAAFAALQPVVVPVPYGQYGGSVAVGPHHVLLTWRDYRNTYDMVHQIFGMRVGPLGELLDGDGVPLTGPANAQASVAALRDQFLIAWAKGPNVYAWRMSGSGGLLDGRPIIVSENPGHPFPELVHTEVSVAADGTSFWVAWTDDRSMPAGTPEHLRYGYQDIYAARISPTGRVLDPRGIRVCARRGNQNTPRLSSRADFIVWSDHRPLRQSIFGARLHPRGLVLDFGGFPITSTTNGYLTAADVSGNARGWLAVWGDSLTGVHAARIHRDRGISRPFVIAHTNAFLPFGVEPATSSVATPQVEATGPDYLVLWQSGWSTAGARVSGKRVGPLVTIASDPTGAGFFSFGGFAGNGSRFWVIGTTAPLPPGGSWFQNEIWYGTFTATMLPP